MKGNKGSGKHLLLSGAENLTFVGRAVVPWAVKYRNDLVLKEIRDGQSHLDLGCGNGYLVFHSPAQIAIGLDRMGGYRIDRRISEKMEPLPPLDIEKGLPFGNEAFDRVTCLAVLEHLHRVEVLLSEVVRVLRREGRFIITTPTGWVDRLLPFLDRGSSQLGGLHVREAHRQTFSREGMLHLTSGLFRLERYRRFQLGLNQLFIFAKEDKGGL